jgi:prepilin-type processing-associated H-X9-DG protein/prepilin-type N-terminal cleavage/methylation domain-containing protein
MGRFPFLRGNSRSFTLVELLVVIAIIGLLAGLSVPAIGRAQATARTAQCASNMRQIVLGLLQWSANNETYLPSFITPVGTNGGYYWYAEVSRNTNTPGGTTLPYCGHNPLLKGESASTVWICPANNPYKSKPATTRDCSYGINSNTVQVKMVNIKKPSQCVAITDANTYRITANSNMATPHNNGMNIAFWDSHVEYTNAIPNYTNAIFSR